MDALDKARTELVSKNEWRNLQDVDCTDTHLMHQIPSVAVLFDILNLCNAVLFQYIGLAIHLNGLHDKVQKLDAEVEEMMLKKMLGVYRLSP